MTVTENRCWLGWLLAAAFLTLVTAGCGGRTGTAGGVVKDTPESMAVAQGTAGQDHDTGARVSATPLSPAPGEAPPPESGAVSPAPERAVDLEHPGTVLERIHFAFDSYLIDDHAGSTLGENAAYLQDRAGTAVLIEGHCDERGTTEYNLALGEKRARSAMTYLRDLGVADARMRVVSYGEELPLDTARTEDAWALNRRAEFRELE